MKLIHLTDLHLVVPGALLHGLDPLARLDICLADILRHHGDADLLVITGDLTDDGSAEAYQSLSLRLEKVGLPYRLLLGNHDLRAGFRAAFPGAPVDEAGFVQSVLDTAEARLIFLDSLHDGQVTGLLCDRRLDWLARRLEEASGRPVMIFMHHPPFGIGQPSLDRYVLEPDSADAFATLVRRHGDIRQIVAGHVHRPCHGLWNGIPVTTVPATAHQMPFDLAAEKVRPVDEPPAYAVVLIDADNTVLHLRHPSAGRTLA